MKLSCINLNTNKSALSVVSQFNKESKNLQHFESQVFAEAVSTFLQKLAEEKDIISLSQIKKGLRHLIRSRKILQLMSTDDEEVLSNMDNLIDKAIDQIDQNLIYLYNSPNQKGVH